MNDFMGINVHTALWRDYYHPNADYTHTDISKAFKWVRNYQRWDQFEPENDDYKWNSEDGGKIFYFDEYYRLLNEDGVNIVVVPMDPPDWVIGSAKFPIDNGTGEEPNNYRERAEFLAQMAARYGPTGGHAESRLETSDKVQGLDYVRYFEDHNEPNQDWREDIWPASYFGQYLNATHDGRGVIRNGEMPLAGIKQGDPNAIHVAAGLNNNGVDDSFLDQMLLASGRQAFDIINIHTYCRNTHLFPDGTFPYPPEAKGTSPEYYIIESGLEEIQKTVEWRDANLPGTPIWLTEFGWDTLDKDGVHSTNYAPELSQANYIMRTFPLVKKIGIEKAFLFFDFDPNSNSTKMFSTSGIFGNVSNGHETKIAYYFLTAMSQTIGEYAYDGAHIFGAGDPEVYAYSFSKSDTDVVVMLWCRERDALFDNGTTIPNYTFEAPYMTSCDLVVPTDDVIGGITTSLSITDAGLESASVTIPLLSETPVFLKVNGLQSIRLNLAPEVYAGKDVEIQSPASSVVLSCDASDSDGTVASYQWVQLSGPSATMQQADTAMLALSGLVLGDYVFEVEVTDDDGAKVRDVVQLRVTSREPYLGSRHTIPGLIQAEDFDLGGEGVAYHDLVAGNKKGDYRPDEDVDIKFMPNETGNFYVTDIKVGEWLEYSVDVAETGLYTLDMKTAAYNDDRRLEVRMDGYNISGMMQIEQTGDFTQFVSNIAEPVRLTAGEHIMRVRFDTSGMNLDSIELQPYDDGIPSGGYFHFVHSTSSWSSKRIFYDVKWQDDIDVLAGGNQFFEFYLSDESPGLTADWSKLRISLIDTFNNSGSIIIGDYETNIGMNWTLVQIPLSVFSAAGVDLSHLMYMELTSLTNGGPFDIGIDEVAFTGGLTPLVWLGETHSNNPHSNSAISLTIEESGGLGGTPAYNEAPFVDANSDVTIRPLVTTHTFDASVIDIDGVVVSYEWTQLSGPTPVSLTGTTSEDLTVEVDTFGTYEFRLTATDNSGNTSEDDTVLTFEDTGGYISVDHIAYSWKTFTIFYDADKEARDVVSGTINNTDLEIYFKRFDLSTPIDWNLLRIEVSDDSSPVNTSYLAVGNYMTEAIDDQWVKVVFPLSHFATAVDFTNLRKITVVSARAGPYNGLGIDEIKFSGGDSPFVWFGDAHPEIVFNGTISSDLVLDRPATGGATQPALP
ncbi:PKD domain-containing protein [Rubellicoccus peritrichatus]|uniref:Carbohydrate-binding protein n=1 Tax=Rubellicoccus peritrichatus TaxID=3080537 RepID=A0AAQ3LD19_9BACT|nr:carbohydrate-binding protein [Puniceicoccus sp. CR14]WOO39754.1 carbohydrate-binding protein [Puniceicoccus sp. CR14]